MMMGKGLSEYSKNLKMDRIASIDDMDGSMRYGMGLGMGMGMDSEVGSEGGFGFGFGMV